jgi:hypothetical protein
MVSQTVSTLILSQTIFSLLLLLSQTLFSPPVRNANANIEVLRSGNENIEVLRSWNENIEVLTNENENVNVTTPDSHSRSRSPATNASALASDISESAPELEKHLLSLKKFRKKRKTTNLQTLDHNSFMEANVAPQEREVDALVKLKPWRLR